MKTNIFTALRFTFVCLAFTGIYMLIVLAIAQISPNQGKGEMIDHKGNKQYANIGQAFTEDQYFWSRPSAVDYNSAGSGGSNKGPNNAEYLAVVQDRIDTFLVHNPGVKKSEIPIDLITASGSGLDPNISIQAAKVQVSRISEARNISREKILKLIESETVKPLLGAFGPSNINVLKLNIALENLK